MPLRRIEDIVSELLSNIPNFIETDFIENEDGTYTLSANFEHPHIDEEYSQVDYLFAEVTFDKDFKIIKTRFTKSFKDKYDM